MITVVDLPHAEDWRRVWWAAGAGLVLFGLSFVDANHVMTARTQPGSRDVDLFAAIVARVSQGEPYYSVLAEELPGRGYPVRPVFAWRLPTLSWLLAGVPTLAVGQSVLWIISALGMWCWARRLRLRAGAVALLLGAPLWLLFSSAAVYMSELWAGQLITLGLALWMLDRPRTAVAAFVFAALIREHAVLALGLVAVFAWRERQPLRPWILAMAGVTAFYGAHIVAVVRHTPAHGITNGWGGLTGWAFMVSAAKAHVLLVAAPYWMAAMAVAICVPTLWLWRDGRIVAVIVTVYAALFCLVARPDNWYWGLLTLPLLPLGCIALVHQALTTQVKPGTRANSRRP